MRKRLKNHFIPHEGNDYKPHFVRERNLIGVALLVVAIFGLAFSVKSLVTRNPDLLSAVITSVLVDLTNSNRLTQNLVALTPNSTLALAAQLKANDMAEKSYFAHTSPEGKSPWYWFQEGGYQFLYAGENLAVNFSESQEVVQAWMNSEGHRANILNDKFSEIGIAMAPGTYQGRDTIYVVQLFGQPVPPETVKQRVVVREEPPSVTILAEEINVSGASAENVEILAESKMFIAVQNDDYVSTATLENFPVKTELDSEGAISVVDRAIASPKTVLEAVYMVIGGIVLLSLILFVVIEPKRQHPKNIVYVVLLLILIVVLFYFSKNYLFPKIIIE